MKTFFKPLIASTALILILAADASAANVHLRKGSPTFGANGGLTLSITAKLVGLGGGDVTYQLAAVGDPQVTCTNPSGKSQPPGQNPAETTVEGGGTIPGSDIKNGNLTIVATTSPPVNPIPGAPDCPSSNWTETITGINFSSAILTVDQPAGTTVLTVTCNFTTKWICTSS